MPQFPHSKYSSSPGAGVFTRAQGSHSPIVEADVTEFVNAPVEYVHPFKVSKVSIAEVESSTVFTFRMFEGQVFGTKNPGSVEATPVAWNLTADSRCEVPDGTNITKIPGSSTPEPDYLDERNVGMKYSVVLDTTHTNVLYIRIERDPEDQASFKQTLMFNVSLDDAASAVSWMGRESTFIVGSDGLEQANTWHAGSPEPSPNPLVVEDLTFANGQGSLSLNQRWDLYYLYSQYEGIYQIPIATITNVGGSWVVRQILRSDVFFPYGLPLKHFFVDTFTDDFYGTCTP